jgi:L-ornithine N5-oxygenase
MAPQLEAIFFEKMPEFAWHPGMLFDDALMQVSFLKDMASFRNPRSRFTFINYLHENQRLADFVNLATFYPTRVEFADYLAWCAAEFVDSVHYGLEVSSIEAVRGPGGRIDRLRLAAAGPSGPIFVETSNILHAGGLEPVLPEGVRSGSRIFHSGGIIQTISRVCPKPGAHYVVAGCGQSAAEIVAFLHSRDPHAEITSVFSRFGYMAADNSPFVNQIFDPQSVDILYAMPERDRDVVLQAHRATNYAAVDVDLIRALYRSVYNDRLRGWERIRVKRLSYVLAATESGEGVSVDVRSGVTGTTEQVRADYLICATGFRPRSVLPLLSEELSSAVVLHCDGQPLFGRAYDLQFEPLVTAKIYSVGMCEATHGLSATLLSNMAVRAGEIAADICTSRLATHPQRPTREDMQFVRL